FRQLPGHDLWWLAYKNVGSADFPAEKAVALTEWRWPGDRGLYTSLCRAARKLCGGRVHETDRRTSRYSSRCRSLRRCPRTLSAWLSGGRTIQGLGSSRTNGRCFSQAFPDEPGFAFSPGSGVQRNAWSAGRSRQEILPEIGAQVRSLP